MAASAEVSKEREGHLCDGFLDRLSGLINKENVHLILSEQDGMLETLEVANEKLSHLNALSEKCFDLHVAEFRTYTQTLTSMKRELDSVFRRIR
ncbi:KxDL motif-containing protein 1 [Geodia barretti]|nr:KxDL motif-containing protein 1 [Geodia barretti]